jgi:hypothetical protein
VSHLSPTSANCLGHLRLDVEDPIIEGGTNLGRCRSRHDRFESLNAKRWILRLHWPTNNILPLHLGYIVHILQPPLLENKGRNVIDHMPNLQEPHTCLPTTQSSCMRHSSQIPTSEHLIKLHLGYTEEYNAKSWSLLAWMTKVNTVSGFGALKSKFASRSLALPSATSDTSRI